MRPLLRIALVTDFTARDKADAAGEFHFKIGILRPCQQLSGNITVDKSHIFHAAALGMADNQERAVGVLPADVLQQHALDGPHLSVSVAPCLCENDFQVFIFDVGFDTDILEADVPHIGSTVTDNTEGGMTAGTTGSSRTEDIAILNEDILHRPAIQFESERDAVGVVPSDQKAAADGNIAARRIVIAFKDLGFDGNAIVSGPDKTVLDQEITTGNGVDAVKSPDSRMGKNLHVTENRMF